MVGAAISTSSPRDRSMGTSRPPAGALALLLGCAPSAPGPAQATAPAPAIAQAPAQAPPPTAALPPAPATPPAPAEPPLPTDDLPARVEPPASERYALDLQRRVHGTHARNWVFEDTRASFVLELAEGGEASACRGLRSHGTNDGPTVHTSFTLREQQGYRGRWRADPADPRAILVELALDAAVCPPTRRYVDLAPLAWSLRCERLAPGARPGAPALPLLACAVTNAAAMAFDEVSLYRAPPPAGDDRLLLGGGDGLRVDVDIDSIPPPDRPPTVRLGPSPEPVQVDTWTRPSIGG